MINLNQFKITPDIDMIEENIKTNKKFKCILYDFQWPWDHDYLAIIERFFKSYCILCRSTKTQTLQK